MTFNGKPGLKATLALSLALACAAARAEEGMWTIDHLPLAALQSAYAFEPTPKWLQQVQRASLRLTSGCSASFVSAQGLVMTNHHCVRGCIDTIAGLRGQDYGRDGFQARQAEDEPRCQGLELQQLLDISDVTERLRAATRDAVPERFDAVQRAAGAAIERECATSEALRCEIVGLYHGGRYDLYRYRRYTDVRLVFAPEAAIAAFGGDPDNFMFPRYAFDVAFVRAWGSDGKPVPSAEHFGWSAGGLREGELSFITGHPGDTSRSLTLAQLDQERDQMLPRQMMRMSECRAMLIEYGKRSAEARRHSEPLLGGCENAVKAMRGQHAALAEPAFHAQLVAAEQALRARVAAAPELQREFGDVWNRITDLTLRSRSSRSEYEALDQGNFSRLFSVARTLLRLAEETAKPDAERLPQFRSNRLPALRSQLLAQRPLDDDYEITLLGWWLSKLREELGPDHAAVRAALGARSPEQVAAQAVHDTRLKELRWDAEGRAVGGYRKELLDGGAAALAASNDPMIELARALEPFARAARIGFESRFQGPLAQQQERLARARFAVYGSSLPPDATFSLRLSYGAIQGWREGDAWVPPFTTVAGAYARHTGNEPFALPPSWLAAKDRLAAATPFNVVTTHDAVGGNSGSPLINRNAEVAGVIFDGNSHSLGGQYGYDAALNRSVAVQAALIVAALRDVYGATWLLQELQPAQR